MDKSNGITTIGNYDSSSKRNDKKTSRRIANEKAISNLISRIPNIDNIFDIHGRIGNGTFSTVLLASLKCQSNIPKDHRKLFAIKHLIPTSHPKRIQKELKCLTEIGGVDNVAGIDLCLRRNESVAFIMPYIAHDRFHDYFDKMETSEIQTYIKNLLIALKRVHSFYIIHRDVKPSNFLYNRKTGSFMLVDFGLAQSVQQCNSTNNNNNTNDNEMGDHNTNGNDRKRKVCNIDDNGDNDCEDDNGNNSTKRFKESENHGIKSNKLSNSPFKMPLKQLNEITTPKLMSDMNGCCGKLNSPLTRQIKSAILSATLTPKLEEKLRVNSNSRNENPSTPKYNTNRNLNSNAIQKCYCYGKSQVCNMCIVKKEIPASRAGTPGYRPPEVLLKYVEQTTAVDIWAVGVILISILSGVYPFFQAPDDFIALAEIVTIFGDESVRRTAFTLGRQVTMSRKCKPLDLRKLCIRLRNRFNIDRTEAVKKYQQQNNGKFPPECINCQQQLFDCLCANTIHKIETIGEDKFPSSVYNLLERLLDINPYKRITATEALNHEFFKEIY